MADRGGTQVLRQRIAPAVALAMSFSAASVVAGVRYEIKDLGTLGGANSGAESLNDLGQVVGYSQILSSTSYHAFIADGGGMHDLGTFGGRQSVGRAINRLGHVVGWAQTASGERHAFLLKDGTMTDLGSLAGSPVNASALNDADQVVGSYSSGAYERAFVWSGGVMQDIGTLGGTDSRAYAVNNHGDVVGFARPLDGIEIHACLWRGGIVTDLGTLGGWASHAYDINDNGKIVGWTMEDPNIVSHAFEWADDIMYDLGTLGGLYSAAFAISSGGDAVGVSTDPADRQHATLWRGGRIEMLDTLIAQGSGWSLVMASDINDHGEIAGYGTYAGDTHAFLLTPLPVLEVPRGGGTALEFAGASPNPGSGSTTLHFTLATPASVRLTLYDVRGREVRTLADRTFGAGAAALDWDGRAGDGSRAGPGIYWARLEVDGRRFARRFTLLR
ncbi:MAG: hypothetical protein HYR73_08710 [Candidatus Eisenbacteria bacterium]|nr:hypothetical protein [Candidatus Eisenbacteria bacterium]